MALDTMTMPETSDAAASPPTIERELTELLTEEPSPDPSRQTTPAAPVTPAPDDPEFDLNGQRVKLSALKTTHQQFAHLQQKHLAVKPILDWIDRQGLDAAHLPVIESLLRETLATRTKGPERPTQGADDPRQHKWFKDLSEYYPDVANELLGFMKDTQAKGARLEQIERTLASLSGVTTQRQQQEAAATELSAFAQQVQSMATTYPDLQQQEHRAQFVQYLVLKNPIIEQLRDPDYLEGMYLRFNRDGIAKQLSAHADEAKAKQAATAAAGFGEGAGRRGPATTVSPIAQEIADLLAD